MTNTLTPTKTLYVGTRDWALVCYDCAGYTLQASIKNAKPGQVKFRGIDNETYDLVDDKFYAVMVEDFAKYDLEVLCDCEAGR
jgi:hypothetical protein